MKSIICCLTFVLLFTGCSNASAELDAVLDLREEILSNPCSFTAAITADYVDELYHFQMNCHVDTSGTMVFTVTKPDTLSDITGTINSETANLTFDDVIISFPPLADGRLSPVTGPWVFINTLRSGYISACSKEKDGYFILADDSYDDNALQLEILTDSTGTPIHAEIFWNQRRIITLKIRDFVIL